MFYSVIWYQFENEFIIIIIIIIQFFERFLMVPLLYLSVKDIDQYWVNRNVGLV